jgi:NADH dehydrogenase
VKQGRVNITDDKNEVVKSAVKGDHFGERALLSDRIWRFNATAMEPTTLVAISARTFDKLVSSIGSLSQLFKRTAETYDKPQDIEHVLAKLPQRCRSGTAKDLMISDVAVLREDGMLSEALDLFQKERHSTYPVVDASGHVRGVLRRRECYEWLKHHVMDDKARIRDLPLHRPLFIAPDMPLPDVFETLIRTGASKAIVSGSDFKLQGMLTLYDVLTCPVNAEAAAQPEAAVPAM